ncbi:MAG: hypothetical protein JWM90_2807 [Thermoleophilia bacterium]|nr:hypothetical protein [Thermoleophilia bacterium]
MQPMTRQAASRRTAPGRNIPCSTLLAPFSWSRTSPLTCTHVADVRGHWQVSVAVVLIVGMVAASVIGTERAEMDAGFYAVCTVIAGVTALAGIALSRMAGIGPLARLGMLVGATASVALFAIENLLAANWTAAIPDGQTGLLLPVVVVVVVCATAVGCAFGSILDAVALHGARAKRRANVLAVALALLVLGGGVVAEGRSVLDRREDRRASFPRIDACVDRNRDRATDREADLLEYYAAANWPNKSVRQACHEAAEDGAIGPRGVLVDVLADD